MGGLFIDLLLFIRPYFHCPIQIPIHVFIKILVHNISINIEIYDGRKLRRLRKTTLFLVHTKWVIEYY